MPTIYLVIENKYVLQRRRMDQPDDFEEERDPQSLEGIADPLKGTPVRAFVDRHRAETYRRSLEATFRENLNPFTFGSGLEDLTSFDLGPFRDWLLDADIGPPEPPEEQDFLANSLAFWSEWWQQDGWLLPRHKRDTVWQGLDKLRFYHVAAFPEEEQTPGLIPS